MQAIALIGQRAGEVVAQASLYESEPQGFISDNIFVNTVIAVKSALSPHEMLGITHQIELDMGCNTHRNADGSYCDRSLDIDIIACEDMICNDETLILPHPRMHERLFVLEPLCEIAPDWVHPILHRSVLNMRNKLLHKD